MVNFEWQNQADDKLNRSISVDTDDVTRNLSMYLIKWHASVEQTQEDAQMMKS